MATRRTTRTSRTVHTHTYVARTWMFKLSFWLVVIIGIAMAVVGILNAAHLDWNGLRVLSAVVQNICFAIGMFIPVVMSYQVARYKSTVWFVLWIVFVVLVVVGLITMIIGAL